MEKRTHTHTHTHIYMKHKKHEIQKENLHINCQPFIFYLLLATCHLALPTLAHVCVSVKCTFYICCKPLQSNRFQTDWEWANQPVSELASIESASTLRHLAEMHFLSHWKLPWISLNQEVLQHSVHVCYALLSLPLIECTIPLAWHMESMLCLLCALCICVSV